MSFFNMLNGHIWTAREKREKSSEFFWICFVQKKVGFYPFFLTGFDHHHEHKVNKMSLFEFILFILLIMRGSAIKFCIFSGFYRFLTFFHVFV